MQAFTFILIGHHDNHQFENKKNKTALNIWIYKLCEDREQMRSFITAVMIQSL